MYKYFTKILLQKTRGYSIIIVLQWFPKETTHPPTVIVTCVHGLHCQSKVSKFHISSGSTTSQQEVLRLRGRERGEGRGVRGRGVRGRGGRGERKE